jgi:hypothetical protein
LSSKREECKRVKKEREEREREREKGEDTNMHFVNRRN